MRVLGVAMLAGSLVASAGSAFAIDGDAEAGAKVFRKCQACHVADSDQNRVGPSLMNVFGRQPGSLEGYNYSNAMKEYGSDGKVWNEETLTAYLHDPRGLVKGTKMAFGGLKKDEEIQNVLAYLAQYSDMSGEASSGGESQ
jgi:cytochrome c